MINHIHLEECSSTQSYLKDYLESSKSQPPLEDILITTNIQHNGIGRSQNKWLQAPDSLAFSFTLKPLKKVTLTPLEIGLHLINFFKKKYEDHLFLKWPNDLLTKEYKKCGGILCQLKNDILIVGIGLNFGTPLKENERQDFKFPFGVIDNTPVSKKLLPLEIYDHILRQRLEESEIPPLWNNSCFHLNKKVEIIDRSSTHQGIFKGIGENGEALIGDDKIFAGSLYLLD